jgi:hypothetical protein
MNINSINSETLFLPYIYGTCVNKKYMPHLDMVEKNLITNRVV